MVLPALTFALAWSLVACRAAPATADAQQPLVLQPPRERVLGPPVYTAAPFPSSLFSSYYPQPTGNPGPPPQFRPQPQPVIQDPITGKIYDEKLTDPRAVPRNATKPPLPLPSGALESSPPLRESAFSQIIAIANTSAPSWTDSCSKCLAALNIAKSLAFAAPSEISQLAVDVCEYFQFSPICSTTYSRLTLGALLSQVFQTADVAGLDGQYLCHSFLMLCPLPPTYPLHTILETWFSKPKPHDAETWTERRRTAKTAPKRVKVLHMSDMHLDPRYSTGSEANCTMGLCCRVSQEEIDVQIPAPYYGSYRCDTPLSLGVASLQAIPQLTNTQSTGFAWTVFTGDLVSHDPDNQVSREYVMYAETIMYDLFKKLLGAGPVYAALGNHDSYLQAQDVPRAHLPDYIADEFSWNYEHVSRLWEHEDWISAGVAKQARAHYGAYSVARKDGLRVITLNTDFWYRKNYFNYVNMTNPDPSGMLRFLTDELQAAEDAKERAWIVGHVLSGWDGSSALTNPTNLFYQIVDRFSPHVISAILFGHTHEDLFTIFYANNGTIVAKDTAQTVAWVAPSISPMTNLNSGFRMYEVDAETFEILDAHTWYSDVSAFSSLDHQGPGPTWRYEYDTRELYGSGVEWPQNAPLNATWWHMVTERMEAEPSLVQTFTENQGKQSVHSPACTSDECVKAKICYLRSGSSAIGKHNCLQGYGTVQG